MREIIEVEWGPTTITLAGPAGIRGTEAWISPQVPGLAIHKCLWDNGVVFGWNVSHIASGQKVVGTFATRDEACDVAVDVGWLADWTLASDELKRTPDLSAKCREINQSHKAASFLAVLRPGKEKYDDA
jgi:hypothetical protein